jgi:hypothetical protein
VKRAITIILILQALIAGFSYFALYQSSSNPELVYHSLKCYWLSVPVEVGHKFFDQPWWHVSFQNFKIPSKFKLIDELGRWLIILSWGLMYLKILWQVYTTNDHTQISNKSAINKQTLVTLKDNSNYRSSLNALAPEKQETKATELLRENVNNKTGSLKSTDSNITNQKQSKNKYTQISSKKIFLYGVLTCIIPILLIPHDTSDLYGYVARGAQQIVYNLNPYQHVIADIENWKTDPLLANMLWQHNPAPYAPMFMLYTKLVVWLAGKSLVISALIFKLINFICFLLCVLASNKITKILFKNSLATDQYYAYKDQDFPIKQEQLSSFNIFNLKSIKRALSNYKNLKNSKIILTALIFNPFIISECLWNAHNDIMLACFIMLAIWSSLRRKHFLSIIFISVSALFKYYTLVLLPLFIIWGLKEPILNIINNLLKYKQKSELDLANMFILREHTKHILSVVVALILSTTIAAILFYKYDFYQSAYNKIHNNLFLSHKSLFDTINSIYKIFSNKDLGYQFKYIALGLFGGNSIIIYYLALKDVLLSRTSSAGINLKIKHNKKNDRNDNIDKTYKNKLNNLLTKDQLEKFDLKIIRHITWVLILLICFFSPKFHSWYLISLLPVCFISYPLLAILLSLSHLLSFTFIDQANILNYCLMTATIFIIHFCFLRTKKVGAFYE